MREDKASPPGDGDEAPAPYQMPPPGALWPGFSEPAADEKPAAAWDAFAAATPAGSSSDAAPAQSSPWDGFAAAWPAPASPPSAPVQIEYSLPADRSPQLGSGSPEPGHDQPNAARARVTVPSSSRLSPDQLPGSLPAGPRAATVYRATPPDPPEPPQPSPEPPPPPYPTPEPRPPAPPPPSPVPPGPVPPGPVPPSPVPPRPGPGPQPEPQPPFPPAPPAPPPSPNPPSPPPGPAPAPPFPPPPPTITGRAAPVPAPPAGFVPHPPAQGLSVGYSQWARHQRPHGNLYSGPAPAGVDYESLDNTDSLTGHILAQGRPDTGDGGNTTRVIMIMLIMLAAVVVVTVIAIS